MRSKLGGERLCVGLRWFALKCEHADAYMS